YNLNRVITDITDVSAFLSIDAFFDIPFMLSNWEADRTFYSPNWTYWVPLIQQNLATPEQAWTETLKAINDAGVSVRYGNFKDTIDIGWDEAIATPEPESMILFITGLICLFSVRATRLDLIR
ncbi:MAG: hypothetical protein LM522_06535, partial [Candidatus Contendobacter sp.]|nr:hypothetical protein [Candidatus Contendobacter sp.]